MIILNIFNRWIINFHLYLTTEDTLVFRSGESLQLSLVSTSGSQKSGVITGTQDLNILTQNTFFELLALHLYTDTVKINILQILRQPAGINENQRSTEDAYITLILH